MSAALLSGPFFHHLDHLAPIAYFLDIPLYIDDPETFQLGKKFYPKVTIKKGIPTITTLGENFSTLFLSTKHAGAELKPAFEVLGFSHMKFCYLPHGQSDKGLSNPEMLSITNHEFACIYGKRQRTLVKSCKELIEIGNFRLAYYKEHQEFLDQITEEYIFKKFQKKQNTILYAPTWQDSEHQTTFFTEWKELIETLPDEYNLIIKLHPLLEKHHPAHVHSALGYHLKKPNVQILFEYPLIYPLLSRIDVYLGDYSSIGYDFLYFNKPMFFLGKEKTPLYDCGKHLTKAKDLISSLSNQEDLYQKRKDLYKYAFSPFKQASLLQHFSK